MARGAGKKSHIANGPIKARESLLNTRSRTTRGSQISRQDSVEDSSDTIEEAMQTHFKTNNDSLRSRKALLQDRLLECNAKAVDISHSKCNVSVICHTSTCVVSRKTSRIIDESEEETFSLSNRNYEKHYGQGGTNIAVTKERMSNVNVREHASTTVLNSVSPVDGCEQNTSNIFFEVVVHLNTILYCMFSMSTEHHLKNLSPGIRKSQLVLDPVALKFLSTLSFGIIADFTSPSVALLIPQVVCLLTGILISVQIFPETLAYLAPYLPLVNSGLVGTQLLLILNKHQDELAAVLSRASVVWCLMDHLGQMIFKTTSIYLGYSLCYQLMNFSSFLGLVAVLYLFHTNQNKGTRISVHQSFLKAVLMKVMLCVPAALFLPHFQESLTYARHGSTYNVVLTVTAGLVTEQAVLTPLLHKISSPCKILCGSAVLLVLLYLSMMAVELSSSISLLLLFIIYSVVGIAQNVVISQIVSCFKGFPGCLLSMNLILHITIRFVIAQIINDAPAIYAYIGEAVWNISSWWESLLNDESILKNISHSLLHLKCVYSKSLYIKCIGLTGSICSIVLALFAKYM